MSRRLIPTLIPACAGILLAAVSRAASPDFLADCRALTRHPHRLTGSKEYADAAKHVEQRLREVGVTNVLVQTFRTVQNVVRRCEAVAGEGRVFPLWPLRPNGIVPPVTPPQGITGQLLHLGHGTPEDFDREDLRGRIVVMNYNAEDRWLKAFRLGAQAVIFTRGEEPADSFHFHYVRANANLPRFFYDGPASDLPANLEITLHSEVTWARATGRNVFGFIPGTAPRFDLGEEEVLVLAAPLDTFGEVPQRTPGAQPAANAAALLKMAGLLAKAPPRRHILLAFFDGHGRNHAGVAAFYQALESKTRDATIRERMTAWQNESAFLTESEKLAARPNPFAERASDAGRELLLRMRSKGADRAYEIRGQLMDLREARSRAERGTPEYDELRLREDRLTELYNRWNELRRRLGKGGADAAGSPEFDAALAEVRKDIAARRAELLDEEQMLRSSAALEELLGQRWITLHATMMLGDRTPQWGVIVGGDSEIRSAQDLPGLYGRIQRTFLQAWRSLGGRRGGVSHFEPTSVDGSLRNVRLLWAAPMLVHGGEMAGRHGIYNIVLGTLHETLPRLGTPDDTLDRLDLDRIEQNTEEAALLLAAVGNLEGASGEVEAVADQRGLSLRRAIMADNDYVVTKFSGGRTQGALVMGRHRGSSIPNRPVPDAVVQVSVVDPWNSVFWRHSKAPGFDPFTVVMTDQNGAYALNALPTQDPAPIAFAAAFDERGLVTQVTDMASRKTVRQRLNMFRCAGGVLVLPPMHWTQKVTFMSSRANAPLARSTAADSYGETTDGVAYWYGEEKLPGIKAFGKDALVALNNAEVEGQKFDPYGRGWPMSTAWLTLRHAEGSAWDLWRLNEARLSLLRSRDILNSALEEAHGRVRDLLEEAAAESSLVRREALWASAFKAARPVYTQVRESMDDLVKAVLVLLALCIPFAFALERLLIGSTMIYKQVAWFIAFFVATFLLLYVSHPAFAIAQTPIIIFLGFAVVVLSGLVIVIIMQKFQVELKRLQGMTSTVHAADISRFSTVMAAMAMGISTMRRRPLRTTLTAVTILLLTFTILGFASFDLQRGVVKIFVAPAPPYTGVMLNNPTWGSFNAEFVDLVRSRWSRDVNVCLRYWICPEFKDDPDFVVALEDGTKPVSLKAVLGVSAKEIAVRPDLQQLFRLKAPADIDRMVLMTEAVATLLKVKPGDRVCLKGKILEVGPLLSAAELSAAREMEGSSILPVDFATMKLATAGTAEVTENVLDEQAKWTSLPVDAVVITSAENSRLLGGKPHLIHFYTKDAQEAAGIAEELARMLDRHPVMATRMDGVYRHVHGTVVAASGVGDLFFPILLGGLVIFGTMLGSVADREKEIYTFSALGLAPPHVASLFFAEALVYSVIGGLGGYLIAQGTLKILTIAADFGLVRVPEMNYSSTNAVITILIVMATVLVSAIYPAIKASRSANPGLMRLWRLPPPEGDVFNIVFPFTVSAYDLTGVVSFLKEHFDNFGDVGLGSFMARDTVVRSLGDGALGLTTQLALAPFDLGVTQLFELRSAPSEIKGIDEVHIRLTRRSGQPKDWERLNRVLLDDLRTQFLLWRSLPQETMEQYRQRTLAAMKANDGEIHGGERRHATPEERARIARPSADKNPRT